MGLIEKVFNDYTFYYEHSKLKKGGSGMLIKKDRFDEIEVRDDKIKLNCSNCSNCIVESIFADLKFDNNIITVGAVYRHPSG